MVCAPTLKDTADWRVSNKCIVDNGQILGTVGRLEHGNLKQLLAPCAGTLRILTTEQIKSQADLMEQDISNGKDKEDKQIIIACVEYCIHPLLNGRTCMMCLAVVDDNEEMMDDERRSVNVISHGQVLRLNVEEASTCIVYRNTNNLTLLM